MPCRAHRKYGKFPPVALRDRALKQSKNLTKVWASFHAHGIVVEISIPALPVYGVSVLLFLCAAFVAAARAMGTVFGICRFLGPEHTVGKQTKQNTTLHRGHIIAINTIEYAIPAS